MSGVCEICSSAIYEHSVVPGYQKPKAYAILQCDVCHTMVASPKKLDRKVYDAIYSVPGGPPGYDRNFQYAKGVILATDPLRYLTSRQDAFWGVHRKLSSLSGKRVLEVGSGLGYFTYALRRAGYEATGIDVSEEAVAKATTNFGEFYQAESVESYASRVDEKFDAIVFVEVIEHLEHPVSVMESALRLLAPSGSIIVTTPNRSFFGLEAPWTTDLPPVHLWWFSESSIKFIGNRLGCNSSMVDFSEYNARFPVLHIYRPPQEPMFDCDGHVIRQESAPIAFARKLGVLQELYWQTTRLAGHFQRSVSSRRPTLVASFAPRY